MKKSLLQLIACTVCLALLLTACGTGQSGGANQGSQSNPANQAADNNGAAGTADAPGEEVILNIAYQYGLAYAPLIIMQEQNLIEAAYKESTGRTVKVEWTQMSSGPDINTGISSGSIDVGFMGVAPAITGVVKGVGYKIFTNLSGQEHGLMTNDDSINSLEDLIGSSNQVALVNIGSIQHIILAKALAEQGFEPHALDPNIVAMKHPDGMTALETGNVSCHLTTNPYIYSEREEADLHELTELADTWSKENSFIVGVAAETLYDENPELYTALCDAVKAAIAYINDNMAETAKITCEYDGNSEEDELKYLQTGKYTAETKGVYELAVFMADAEFIESVPGSYSELVFDNVVGD